ncbi:hypothetical protein [Nonomuraea sp. GTA35]|uniref:hypothetical protein n=1 Tax=Nonomuraea sp. GTA35 TaxID=1676746 RepID=UPI0035C167BD
MPFDACASAREVRADIHEAFLELACALVCWRRLTSLRVQLFGGGLRADSPPG